MWPNRNFAVKENFGKNLDFFGLNKRIQTNRGRLKIAFFIKIGMLYILFQMAFKKIATFKSYG